MIWNNKKKTSKLVCLLYKYLNAKCNRSPIAGVWFGNRGFFSRSAVPTIRREFDIRMSVHRNIIPNYIQQDAKFFIYLFLQTLYMFQAVPPPIIRST